MLWITNCSSVIYWKDGPFSTQLPITVLKTSGAYIHSSISELCWYTVPLSVSAPLSCYLDCYSFIIRLEIRSLIFFAFPYKLKVSLSVSLQKPTEILNWIVFNLFVNLEGINILMMLNLQSHESIIIYISICLDFL